MSQDQEPTPKQRLRHALRDLHLSLDDKAPRWMGTRARAAALLPLLTTLAGDFSPFGDAHDEPSRDTSPTPPTEPASSAGARRRTPATGPATRRLARAGASGSAGRSVQEPAAAVDASGVELGEPAADERRSIGDEIREWFFSL